jgi:CheY-like chemotaxis protein
MNRTVLVVEDDEELRQTLAELLRAEGYKVDTAGNGRQALERLPELGRPVILLDLLMPEMTGWDLLRELEVRGHQADVIILSASHHEAPAGYRYLHKPVDVPKLMRELKRHSPRVQTDGG